MATTFTRRPKTRTETEQAITACLERVRLARDLRNDEAATVWETRMDELLATLSVRL